MSSAARLVTGIAVGLLVVIVTLAALVDHFLIVEDPDFDDLRRELSELPGVAAVEVEVTLEDTDSWHSELTVRVEDDVSVDELAAALEHFEDAEADSDSAHGLAATFVHASEPDGSEIDSSSQPRTSAEDRATWFCDLHTALPDATFSISEDDVEVFVGNGPETVTSAARTISELSIDDADELTITGNSEGDYGNRLSTTRSIDNDLIERWENTWEQLALLDDSARPIEAELADSASYTDETLTLTVSLAMPTEAPSVEEHGAMLEPVVAGLLADDLPGGQVRELIVEAKAEGAGSPFIDVTADGSEIRYGDLEGSSWHRFAEGLLPQ